MPGVRWIAPIAVLAVVLGLVSLGRGPGRPSTRDDEVFLQAAYLHRTEHVRTIEAITEAAANQFGWTGDIAARLRKEGDIQTYALIPVWARIGGFRVGTSPTGRPLYVESHRLSLLSQAGFVLAVMLLWWALLPLGRGVALVAALLVALGHPFRHGPALFDPWVMPAVTASIGCFLRGRHRSAAGLAAAATLIKPNYLFLLPAFLLAALVRPGDGDPADPVPSRRAAATHAVALAAVIGAYLVLARLHVIATGQYSQGVRSGYSLGVLAYSTLETLGFVYRAGVQQFRHHWPVFPWAFLNAGVLAWLGWRAWAARRLTRTTVLLAGLLAIPILADFAVMGSVHAYEDGGHFRWINVSILGMAVALPLAWREAGTLSARWRGRPRPTPVPSGAG